MVFGGAVFLSTTRENFTRPMTNFVFVPSAEMRLNAPRGCLGLSPVCESLAQVLAQALLWSPCKCPNLSPFILTRILGGVVLKRGWHQIVGVVDPLIRLGRGWDKWRSER